MVRLTPGLSLRQNPHLPATPDCSQRDKSPPSKSLPEPFPPVLRISIATPNSCRERATLPLPLGGLFLTFSSYNAFCFSGLRKPE